MRKLVLSLVTPLVFLTACSNAESSTTEQSSDSSPLATSSDSTSNSSPSGVELISYDSYTGEKVATYLFTEQSEFICGDKKMLQLTFNVSVEPDAHSAPNYSVTDWNAYANGERMLKAGATVAAAKCTPPRFRSVPLNPGESEDNIVVILDTAGATELRYEPTSFGVDGFTLTL